MSTATIDLQEWLDALSDVIRDFARGTLRFERGGTEEDFTTTDGPDPAGRQHDGQPEDGGCERTVPGHDRLHRFTRRSGSGARTRMAYHRLFLFIGQCDRSLHRARFRADNAGQGGTPRRQPAGVQSRGR